MTSEQHYQNDSQSRYPQSQSENQHQHASAVTNTSTTSPTDKPAATADHEHIYDMSHQYHPTTTAFSPNYNVNPSSSTISDSEDLSSIPQFDLDRFLPPDLPMTIQNFDSNGNILPGERIPLRRQIFNDRKILKQVLTKPKKGVYMCNHCDSVFYTFGELLDHFDRYDVKRPHKCSHKTCPWSIVGFNRIRQLNRHESSVHSTDKDFKCHIPNCNKKFGRVDLLNRHLKSVHENKNSRFNRKLSKDHTVSTSGSNTSILPSGNYSPTGSLSSIEDHHHGPLNPRDETMSPIIPLSTSSGLSTSSFSTTDHRTPSTSASSSQQQQHHQQPRQNSRYKHTIEFLTDSPTDPKDKAPQ